MKITVLKSTVEEALAPILKMVANAKLPIDCHPTLTFQSDKQRITIGCTLPEQQFSIVIGGSGKKEPPSIAARRPVRRKYSPSSSIPCHAIAMRYGRGRLRLRAKTRIAKLPCIKDNHL